MATVIANPQSFREEARWQRVCAVCDGGGAFHAHHVLYEQMLERKFGLSGNALFDPRNALRICTDNCHTRHHWKIRPIKTAELVDDNISYAFEVMGLYGADWLRQYYDDTTPDKRIRELELSLS
jgi:hypothetical protein